MSTRFLLIAALSTAAAACTSSSSATLHITNNSDFAITEMHVTPTDSSSWGPNLLHGDTLNPGEQMAVDTSCGTFDVLLVDESGVDCQLNSIDLCANDRDFVIDNSTCSVFVAARAAQSQGSATH